MKKKDFSKKLTLNKNTVNNLNSNDQQAVNGGNKTGITCFRTCDSLGGFSCAETECQCYTEQLSCVYTDCYSACICQRLLDLNSSPMPGYRRRIIGRRQPV